MSGQSFSFISTAKKCTNGIDLHNRTELDREEKATREDPDRRLGLQGTYEKDANWHGGRIQQIIRLAKVDKKVGQYKIVMEPMERRRSHRFARFVGSRRMLQLRVSDKAFMEEKDKVVEFLTKKFVLLGRVFVPFHSKDGSVYMVETDENYDRMSQDWCADGERLSFPQFMEWHNPLRYNSRQVGTPHRIRFRLELTGLLPGH
jgi:RNA dependent RNA polymerase